MPRQQEVTGGVGVWSTHRRVATSSTVVWRSNCHCRLMHASAMTITFSKPLSKNVPGNVCKRQTYEYPAASSSNSPCRHAAHTAAGFRLRAAVGCRIWVRVQTSTTRYADKQAASLHWQKPHACVPAVARAVRQESSKGWHRLLIDVLLLVVVAGKRERLTSDVPHLLTMNEAMASWYNGMQILYRVSVVAP
jgi:hypothetical protein